MGNEVTTMQNLDRNPPESIEQAVRDFQDRHFVTIRKLTMFTADSKVRNYYLNLAKNEGIGSLESIVHDTAFITFISAHLKYKFEHKKSLGTLSLCNTLLLPMGNSSNPVSFLKRRLTHLAFMIGNSYSEYQKRKQKFTIGLVIEGYIRMFSKKHELLIPTVIVELCTKYYLDELCYESDEIASEHKITDFRWNAAVSKQQEQCVQRWISKENDDADLWRKRAPKAFDVPSPIGDTPWFSQELHVYAMPSLYDTVLKNNGWSQILVNSLEAEVLKFSSRHQQALSQVYSRIGKFIDSLNQQKLPLRSYNDQKIQNVNCSTVVQCTPRSLARLVTQTPQIASSTLVFPIWRQPPSDYDLSNIISDIYYRFDSHRDMSYFSYLMRNSAAKEFNHSEISIFKLYEAYFGENIPTINIASAEQESTTFSVEKIFTDIITTYDVIQSMAEVTSFAKKLLQSRERRVFTLAFALTVRKHMLQIEDNRTTFGWNLKLDCSMVQAANELIKICDEYVYTMWTVNKNGNIWVNRY